MRRQSTLGSLEFARAPDRVDRGACGVRQVGPGVEWQRERHSYAGAGHGFTVEVTTGRRSGTAPWTMLVVKEYWRSGRGEELKSHQWAHIEAGRRADVVAWLERQERRLEGV